MKSDYDKIPRTQETRYRILVRRTDKKGRTFFNQAGFGLPLRSESGGLRLFLHMFPEVDLILKEELNPLRPDGNKEAPSAAPGPAESEETPF